MNAAHRSVTEAEDRDRNRSSHASQIPTVSDSSRSSMRSLLRAELVAFLESGVRTVLSADFCSSTSTPFRSATPHLKFEMKLLKVGTPGAPAVL